MDASKPNTELARVRPYASGLVVPALVADAGNGVARRFLEFFTANIPNPNTRLAYAQAVGQFLRWAEDRGLTLKAIEPIAVAAYVEQLKSRLATPSVKQHLAAVRMVFDWLVTGQIPASLGVGEPWGRRALGSASLGRALGSDRFRISCGENSKSV